MKQDLKNYLRKYIVTVDRSSTELLIQAKSIEEATEIAYKECLKDTTDDFDFWVNECYLDPVTNK